MASNRLSAQQRAQEEQWRRESDAEALTKAEEIRSDPIRYAGAREVLLKRAQAAQRALGRAPRAAKPGRGRKK